MKKNQDINLAVEIYGHKAFSFLDELKETLGGSEFQGEEVAILSHYFDSNVKFPGIPNDFYEKLGPHESIKKSKFDFIDLFAGIGGFRLAMEPLGGQCMFSSEWEPNAKLTYFRNHGSYPFGDINKYTGESISDDEVASIIPNHDILAAGFPCQPFSLAGVSARNAVGKPHGLECNTQGTLFWSIERIAKIKRPKLLLLENVKNIISHDGRRTFAVIKKSLEDAGYEFFYDIVNSETVVPQRRKRCFMVCVRKDLHKAFGDFTFPSFSGDSIALSTIIRPKVHERFTISEALWSGHQARSKRNLDRGTGFSASEADLSKPSNTIVARYGKDGKECLIPQNGKTPRMLSIEECKDLFGYPDHFAMPEAKTTSYKLFGNSVVVPVVRKIASEMVKKYLT